MVLTLYPRQGNGHYIKDSKLNRHGSCLLIVTKDIAYYDKFSVFQFLYNYVQGFGFEALAFETA